MERRWFGSMKREVAVIGQGTWYVEKSQGGPVAAVAALRRGLDLGTVSYTHLTLPTICSV